MKKYLVKFTDPKNKPLYIIAQSYALENGVYIFYSGIGKSDVVAYISVSGTLAPEEVPYDPDWVPFMLD